MKSTLPTAFHLYSLSKKVKDFVSYAQKAESMWLLYLFEKLYKKINVY